MITKLQTIYADYAVATRQTRQKARFFDGFWGMGKDPRKAACHDDFYQAVGAWIEEFLAAQPEQAQLLEAAEFMLNAPVTHKDQECFWYMQAVQGYLKQFVAHLSKENCRTLAQQLEALYKRKDRVPVQEEFLKQLVKAGK